MSRRLLIQLHAPHSAQSRAAAGEWLGGGFDGLAVDLRDNLSQILENRLPGPLSAAGPLVVISAPLAIGAIGETAAALRNMAAAAAGRGATFLNLQLQGESAALSPGSPRSYACRTAALHELLHAVRYDVEASGVELTLEAPRAEFLTSPLDLREIIDQANCWAIGACVDAAAIAGPHAPADWLATLGRRVRLVRVGAGSAPCSEGRRHVDDSVEGALQRIHFCGCMILSDSDPSARSGQG